ncbi:hypothetical protein A3Q34_14220 [Colwellia sp. PAMC 20917]|uniref:thioredoxin family protein n=1 Tax=Colwellia sp. PAMC 20917 TaxID=1816218 RepID=UPI00087815FD|nr:thioredoxin family protein [Colwellia sp. PAMC 20917]AOW77898.1 hypothetical protein A3Q34_14220 [Colwellia sp. PAMC 20917]
MKIILITLFFLLTHITAVNAVNVLPTYSTVYDESRDSFKDSLSAIKVAKETNKNVLMIVGGNWCSFCKKMDDFIKDSPKVAEKLYNNFVVLKINYSDEYKNDEFLKHLPPISSYPHIYISTSSGKMVFSNNTLNLQENSYHTEKKWLDFIEHWQPK